jgi:hypothetical protein
MNIKQFRDSVQIMVLANISPMLRSERKRIVGWLSFTGNKIKCRSNYTSVYLKSVRLSCENRRFSFFDEKDSTYFCF